MYICDECGKTFEDPIEEKTDYGQILKVSPCCSETYSEARSCQECGADVARDHLIDGFCETCARETLTEFNMLLKSNFTANQIEFLEKNWC